MDNICENDVASIKQEISNIRKSSQKTESSLREEISSIRDQVIDIRKEDNTHKLNVNELKIRADNRSELLEKAMESIDALEKKISKFETEKFAKLKTEFEILSTKQKTDQKWMFAIGGGLITVLVGLFNGAWS